jgi:hypothetical protein
MTTTTTAPIATIETHAKWNEDDDLDFQAAVRLTQSVDFKRWMDRCERVQRRALSSLGEKAGTAAPQVMAAGLAVYNTIERLVPQMEAWVKQVEARHEAEAERLKLQGDKTE